ncbi:MAG TPA: dihydrofolate reductase [Polyangiaceae bacterium]|jgi:dihydrofolate reductase|nr:dihydrofolate reductase [Polyangiaceae bacterium]
MRGIIFAVSPEGVIGKGGTIPWRHPGDWKRFKRVTLHTTVVMGRKTFESMGKALPERRNIVVTGRGMASPGIECVASLQEALARAGGDDVWFIGGSGIYAEAMKYADRIDVTYVPDHVDPEGAVLAPLIDESVFEAGPVIAHEDEPGLTRRVYARRQ